MKILLVGLGGAGQRHVRNFREILGTAGRFFAYRSRGRAEVITTDFRVDPSRSLEIETRPSLEAALAEGPDAVVISNPTSLHLPVALASARAGAHVLIEKPLSHSREGAAELEATLREKRRVGLVGYMMRFHPCLRQIRAWLDEGRLGKIFSARLEVSSFVPDWHPYEDYRQLYAVKRELGGGVVLTESHELDLAYWFFGKPRRVFAVGGGLSGRTGDVEDTASITLEYGHPVHVQMSFMQRPPSRSCEISGEKAKISWDGGSSVKLFEGSWTTKSFEGYERAHLFRDEAAHFLSCIEGREQPLVDVAAGAASLEIALGALESMRSGQPVEIR